MRAGSIGGSSAARRYTLAAHRWAIIPGPAVVDTMKAEGRLKESCALCHDNPPSPMVMAITSIGGQVA